jgi:hypothetical protein
VDSAAIRTAVTLYPGRLLERLEIAKDKTVSPEPIASTHGASGRLSPGVAFAELKKPLYINRKV